MHNTFENYLIMVGIRSAEFAYADEMLFERIDYFKLAYDNNVSPYYALEQFQFEFNL